MWFYWYTDLFWDIFLENLASTAKFWPLIHVCNPHWRQWEEHACDRSKNLAPGVYNTKIYTEFLVVPIKCLHLPMLSEMHSFPILRTENNFQSSDITLIPFNGKHCTFQLIFISLKELLWLILTKWFLLSSCGGGASIVHKLLEKMFSPQLVRPRLVQSPENPHFISPCLGTTVTLFLACEWPPPTQHFHCCWVGDVYTASGSYHFLVPEE